MLTWKICRAKNNMVENKDSRGHRWTKFSFAIAFTHCFYSRSKLLIYEHFPIGWVIWSSKGHLLPLSPELKCCRQPFHPGGYKFSITLTFMHLFALERAKDWIEWQNISSFTWINFIPISLTFDACKSCSHMSQLGSMHSRVLDLHPCSPHMRESISPYMFTTYMFVTY